MSRIPQNKPPAVAAPPPRPQPSPPPAKAPPAQAPQPSQESRFDTASVVKLVSNVSNVVSAPAALVGVAMPKLSAPLQLLSAVGSAGSTATSLHDALNQGNTAAVLSVPRNALGTASTIASVQQARAYRQAYQEAASAFRAAAPTATPATVKTAAHAAVSHATAAFERINRASRVAGTAVLHSTEVKAAEHAVQTAVSNSGVLKTSFDVVDRREARPLIFKASKAAATSAARSIEHAGASALGRSAARFAPGLNVAVATLDVGIAAATLADPAASRTAKVTSVITALGSVAAATNIPLLSQAGAVVSTASSLVGGFWG